jgi:hypothetical protein
MRTFELRKALLSGERILIYSKPGWNASEICRYLERNAAEYDIGVVRDTLYSSESTGEHILSYQNSDGWNTIVNESCGFEKNQQQFTCTHSDRVILKGEPEITDRYPANGSHSVILDKNNRQSPAYKVYGIRAGAVISSAIKCRFAKEEAELPVQIICLYTTVEGKRIEVQSDQKPGQIHKEWYQTDLFHRVTLQPADSTLTCYVHYAGDHTTYIDDFTLQVYFRE